MKLNTAEDILSVIRQKGKSQNECFKKTKHTKFSEKTNISCPPDTHTSHKLQLKELNVAQSKVYRSAFMTLWNIYDRVFYENS